MKKKILIIGGTGFLGFHLAKKLLKRKWIIYSLSTKKPKLNRNLKKVIYLNCDISKKKSLLILLNKIKVNYVVNFGGYVDHSNAKKTYSSHFEGCKNLANYFLDKDIKLFIQIGSSLENGKVNSPHPEKLNKNLSLKSYYALSKFKASKFLIDLKKKFNFPCTIVRPYLVYGPEQDFNRLIPIVIKNCMYKKKFDCTTGIQKRDFLYIDDFINGLIKLISYKKKPNDIINIGYGKPIKVKKVIEYIKKTVKNGNPIYGALKIRKDESRVYYPNIDFMKKEIKWRPKINLQKGLSLTIKSYQKWKH